MEDMVNFMSKFVKKVTPDDSLAGFIKNKSGEQKKPSASPDTYFFLTDLCSPMDTYIKKNSPNMEISLETKKKMNTGNKIHRFAVNWFQWMNGFESSESLLDGIYFGLPVRGRIDARISGSIIELKSKDKIPENKEEVISLYPYDLEQIAFYTCIDPTKPKINHLIFISQGVPYKIVSFKIEIKDFNQIKHILKNRIDELNKALKEKEPSPLKKYGSYVDAKQRDCEILSHIEISEDKEFEQIMQKSLESWDGHQDTLIPYNIIVPRKYLYKQTLGVEDEYSKEPDDVRDTDYARKMAFELRKSFLPFESDIKQKNFKEISFPKQGWIRRKSSMDPKGKDLPFIAYSSRDDRDEAMNSPGKYKLAELGIIVSNFNLSKGIIIVYYPGIGEDKYKVFEIEYAFDESCKTKIREIIEILKSENISKLKELPPCPWWIHKDKKGNSCCS